MGGTIARHSFFSNDDVYVVIVTEGCSSQYPGNTDIIEQKKKEAKEASRILGVKKVFFCDYTDMKLDTIEHIKLNGLIEHYIKEVKPNVVYTLFPDVNKDHKLIFESTLVATRPFISSPVKKVLTYGPLSSVEWSSPFHNSSFIPNYFVDISRTLEMKIKAFSAYKSEMREYPHPRSIKGIEINALNTGLIVGFNAAEPFMLVRQIVA